MSYLSVADYVARFGAQETWLFTNRDPSNPLQAPNYDAAMVETALSDATDEVDGYVGRRYATPLSSPPTIVKGWVAAIARLKLAEGTGRVSDAIEKAADRATRQLEQLVASKLDLPVPENTDAPAPVGTGTALTSGDRDAPVFGSALDRYTAPFSTGGDCLPRWMR